MCPKSEPKGQKHWIHPHSFILNQSTTTLKPTELEWLSLAVPGSSTSELAEIEPVSQLRAWSPFLNGSLRLQKEQAGQITTQVNMIQTMCTAVLWNAN